MTNLSVSSVCQLDCSYCFASSQVSHESSGGRFLSLDELERRLDFLDGSEDDQVRLIGGEPTLHPEFAEIVDRVSRRGKKLLVFSNALMPERSLAAIERLPVEACTVLVNVNSAQDIGEQRFGRVMATLCRLAARAMLGFNIYRSDLALEFLLAVIEQTHCQRVVRLGLAHPCVSGVNEHLLPSQYPVVGARIAAFARRAADLGIRVSFDCGFVRCMFTDEDLADLVAAQADIGWNCGPILDVDVPGNVTHCYPLAELVALPLADFADVPALADAFRERTAMIRPSGIYPECPSCHFKLSGVCPGGCLAATFRRFERGPLTLDVMRPPEGVADPLRGTGGSWTGETS